MLTTFLVTFFLVLLLLAIGVWIVESGKIMAIKRFGRFVRVGTPGLNIIFPLVETGEILSTQTHQREFPQEDDAGKKEAFRILQKGMNEAKFYKLKAKGLDPSLETSYKLVEIGEFVGSNDVLRKAMSDDPLHSPLTSEVAVVVEWSLYNNSIRVRSFIENIEPKDGRTREEEADKRIEDVIAKTLQEFLGVTTVGHARDRFPLLNSMIKLRLEELVGEEQDDAKLDPKSWGINVTKAYIKSIDPGHRVNTQRAEAAGSVSKMQETINAAEAQAQAKIKDGKAEASKIEAIGEAAKNAKIKDGEAEASKIKAIGLAQREATMMSNEAEADRVLKVVKPSAEDDRTVAVVQAMAYRDNETVISVGGTPLISIPPK